MNEQQLRGAMGLCVRARQAVFGEDGCIKAIRKGEIAILLLDEGASEATKEKYRGVCENASVPLAMLREDLILEATGRPGVAMAVKKGSLGSKVLSVALCV